MPTGYKVYELLGQLGHMAYLNKRQSYEMDLKCAEDFVKEYGPSGSGFDCGTRLIGLTDKKIVLATDFHHMNDVGMYVGWSHHKIIVTPVLNKFVFNMRVTGPNRNGIKEYISDMFHDFLNARVEEITNGMYLNFISLQWQQVESTLTS